MWAIHLADNWIINGLVQTKYMLFAQVTEVYACVLGNSLGLIFQSLQRQINSNNFISNF